jgi:hypothetical protein
MSTCFPINKHTHRLRKRDRDVGPYKDFVSPVAVCVRDELVHTDTHTHILSCVFEIHIS